MGFDIKEGSDYMDVAIIIHKARVLGKIVGEGSSRAVIDYKDGKVIKLAFWDAGMAQNNAEVKIWESAVKNGCEALFTQIYKRHPNSLWIVHSRANEYPSESALNNALRQYYGYDHKELYELIALVGLVKENHFDQILSEENPKYPDIQKILREVKRIFEEKDQPLYSLLKFVVKESRLKAGDLSREDSWGKDANTGKPVIRDYGLTDQVWNEFYDMN